MTTEKMYELRAGKIHQAREINDKANGRELTAEERGQIDRLFRDVDRIELRMHQRPKFDPSLADDEPRSGRRATAEYRATYEKYIRSGDVTLGEAERRALVAENDPSGGYMIPPEQTAEAVIKFVDDNLPIRQLATTLTVTGSQSLGVPSLDIDVSDADWTTELTTGTEDTAMKFGKRELQPRPLVKRVRVASKLLRRAKNAEALVNERLAFKLLLTMEKAYLTGSGALRPLGVFTASSQGISTARDVSAGNTTTSIGGDGLINALYSLKEGYLRSPSLRWLFHRDAVKQTRLLKDSGNAYLWQPGLSGTQPDTILGVPVLMSEFAPNTFTTGLYVGLVGDFSCYWIADADTFGIQRLNELYAETSQTGFIGRFESDGTPALEEAFTRVKLA